MVTFQVPGPFSAHTGFTFGIWLGGLGREDAEALPCVVEWTPTLRATYYEVPVVCRGADRDSLRLAYDESALEIRAFVDATAAEIYFQNGRVAITEALTTGNTSGVSLFLNTTDSIQASSSSAAGVTIIEGQNDPPLTNVKVLQATAYPIKSIWTTPEKVRAAPRVYRAHPHEVAHSTVVPA